MAKTVVKTILVSKEQGGLETQPSSPLALLRTLLSCPVETYDCVAQEHASFLLVSVTDCTANTAPPQMLAGYSLSANE